MLENRVISIIFEPFRDWAERMLPSYLLSNWITFLMTFFIGFYLGWYTAVDGLELWRGEKCLYEACVGISGAPITSGTWTETGVLYTSETKVPILVFLDCSFGINARELKGGSLVLWIFSNSLNKYLIDADFLIAV